ncbi:MAG: hypothetical protein KDA44_15875 [Planctomycetales bacterium]|nr:hypothetical protein [Planctomycetales bacterium]
MVCGCGPKAPYDLAPVSGVVTLDGEPLAGGVVSFQPRADGDVAPGPGSTGRCDKSGQFTLQTIKGEPGAVVGAHHVRIYSHSSDQPVASDDDRAGAPRERVPARYNYQSDLTADVPAAGIEQLQYDLKTEASGDES